MRYRTAHLFVFILTLFFLRAGAVSFADAPPAPTAEYPPNLEELIKIALERSPLLNATREKALAYGERVKPAGALADPTLELSLQENVTKIDAPEFSQATVEVNQILPFPGKRRLSRLAAAADAQTRSRELTRAEKDVVMKVRLIYARLYALDRERRSLEVSGELLKTIAHSASAHYAAGESEQEALLKAQLAVSRFLQRIEDVKAERQIQAAELNRLLDEPADMLIGEVTDLPVVNAGSLAEDIQPDKTSDVLVKAAEVLAADRRVEAAKRELYPDFLVGAGAGLERNYVDDSLMPMGMLKFGITLPVWQGSRQRPLIRAAEHEKKSAVAEQRESEAAARSKISSLKAQWQRDERQITLLREAVLPQSTAALDAARAAYLSGRGDFSTMIEDFNLWLDARVELAEKEADRFSIWAELETLKPVSDSPKATE